MSIALSHPQPTAPSARPTALPTEEAVTLTLTITLPAGVSPSEAASIADSLHARARRIPAVARGTSAVRIDAPHGRRAASLRSVPAGRFAGRGEAGRRRPLAPQRGASAPSATGLRLAPRTDDADERRGVLSPSSPAARDARAALRARTAPRLTSVATPLSPASPADARTTGLVLDLYGRRLRLDGEDVVLTHKEFELLAHLARHARTALTRADIMATVWADAEETVGERTVDVHVRRVRAKLGRYRRLISTVRGAGYRLDPGSDVTILGLAG